MQVTLSQCETALENLKHIEYIIKKGNPLAADEYSDLTNAIDIFAALITDAADSGALYDEEDGDTPQICADCAGSGEGKFDGSVCDYCNGRGEW